MTPTTPDLPEQPEPPPDQALTEKQERFVEEFLLDPDRQKAAIRAGYPRASAATMGWENYRKPHIRAAIERGKEERRNRNAVEADRVVREMSLLAFSDIGDVEVDEDGKVLYAIPECRRAVKKVKIRRRVTAGETIIETELEFHDKQRALVTLMTHLGMLHTELPPLEVLLNRLPPNIAAVMRKLIANPNLRQKAADAKAAKEAQEREQAHQPTEEADHAQYRDGPGDDDPGTAGAIPG